MAKRPLFLPNPDGQELVDVISLEIVWNPGFALSQKRKNVVALHDAAASLGLSPVLEISTKSESRLGQHLSAFHLKVQSAEHGLLSLESAFQGSKVFERGGPLRDLYPVDARTAKRDPRLRASGNIIAFDYDGFRFPSEPKTAFYDWLYINALFEHRKWLSSRILRYAAFTDIEFNPERSINCQARSCALFVSLMRKELLDVAVRSPRHFLALMARHASEHPVAPNSSQRFPGLEH
jgi:hypothetical protein